MSDNTYALSRNGEAGSRSLVPSRGRVAAAASCGSLTVRDEGGSFDPGQVSPSCSPPSPSDVQGSETVSVPYTITNNNDAAASVSVEVVLAGPGESVGFTTRTVPANDTYSSQFNFIPDNALSSPYRGTTAVEVRVSNVQQASGMASAVASGLGVSDSTVKSLALPLGTGAAFAYYFG